MESKRSVRAGALTLAVAAMTATSASAAPLGPPQVLATAPMEMALVAAGDRDGNAVLVLRPGGGAPVVFERQAGGGWSGPAALPGRGVRPSLQVAAAGSGAAAIVWRRADYGAIQATLRAPGGTFGAPVTVAGPSAGGVRHPTLGVDARGGAVVAYQAGVLQRSQRQGGARIEVAVHRPGAGGFGRPVVLTRGPAGAPALAVNDDGNAVVSWRRGARVEVVSITAGRVGETRVLGRAYGSWNPGVAIGRGGDAVVAWSSLRNESRPPAVERFVAASVRRGRDRFARPDVLTSDETARYVHAAVAEDGRAMVAWASWMPNPVVRAAVARPGARRFAPPSAAATPAKPFDIAFAAAPSGFMGMWPGDRGWRLALAGPGAPLSDAGQVSDPFLEGYRVDPKNAAVFGDRLGRVTAVWVQPPAVPPPVPGPTPQTPMWTLEAAEGVVLPPARG